jgi:putative acetyltransferase
LTASQIVIRPEGPDDVIAIRDVVLAAMRQDEADIVDALRDHGKAVLSLVAVLNGRVVGHILFSPATFDDANPRLPGLGLGPLAVLPEFQNQGIGSALVGAGLEQCRRLGYGSVILMGHPTYYPRFGFQPASRFGILPAQPMRDPDALMALELEPGALSGVSGIAREAEEFGWEGL